MSVQDEEMSQLIAQFIEISGGEENVARFYLSSSNWSLEDALSNFLGNQSENDNDPIPSLAPVNDENEEGSSARAHSSNAPRSAATAGGTSTNDSDSFGFGVAKPKVATLHNMPQRPTDENEEEGQAFYAGGSERSGQQVLGPPKRKNFREQLTEMFRMAHEHSAPETATSTPSTSSGSSWGQGVRLGMTDSDHAVVTPRTGVADATGGEKKPVVVLKLWSQGFSIDDGELRLYDDPENKEFLETVMRGEIPHELLEMGWMVNVDVEDHRHEDYKQRKTVKNFKGSGHTLGSPTPNVEGVDSVATAPSSEPAAKPSSNTADGENMAKDKLKINTAAPTTTIQIRLADGSRLTAQFNLTHTVADIHQFVQNARPQYANQNFILVSSFPTRELTDDGTTIEEASLKNAALMQRLK